MAKRSANTELTDRNWDQEYEAEEAGEFTKATDEALKGRQIIKATRRRKLSDGPVKAAFSGFGGFKPTQTSTPLFSGGFFKTESKISEESKKSEENISDSQTTESSKSPAKRQKADNNGSEQSGANGCSPERTTYLSNLKALNISVMKWISQHLEKNPYCILTPIFKDYENHLGQMEKDQARSESNGSSESTMKKQESVKPMEEDKPVAPKTGLTFGMGLLQAKSDATAGFSGFAFKPSTTTTSTSSAASGFGLASGSSGATGSGFSFAVGSSQASSSQGSSGGDDDVYVPPVVETIEHREEGSLYSKKCKLFYQKDGAWTERGVGYLHLKKTDDMAQLLVRADTTLGNILLNIRLSESMPLSRQGKNNVSMMCIVNPPIPKVPDDKPIPMLIRVKTGDDADELVEKMKEIRS